MLVNQAHGLHVHIKRKVCTELYDKHANMCQERYMLTLINTSNHMKRAHVLQAYEERLHTKWIKCECRSGALDSCVHIKGVRVHIQRTTHACAHHSCKVCAYTSSALSMRTQGKRTKCARAYQLPSDKGMCAHQARNVHVALQAHRARVLYKCNVCVCTPSHGCV